MRAVAGVYLMKNSMKTNLRAANSRRNIINQDDIIVINNRHNRTTRQYGELANKKSEKKTSNNTHISSASPSPRGAVTWLDRLDDDASGERPLEVRTNTN